MVNDFLPEKNPVKILITSGASCPDALVEAVIRKLCGYFPVNTTVEAMVEAMQ